ncbi:MAG: hypothetical protein JWN04_3553 [Myxococcaceae bacterium]|nr:hypothetical protein [Myxococcaceae bacterium]
MVDDGGDASVCAGQVTRQRCAPSAHACRTLVACAGLLLAACADDRGPTEQYSVAPAGALRVPQLGCFETIPAAGSCGRNADCSAEQRCVFDGEAAWGDRALVALRCAAPSGVLPAKARCARGSECESGLCGLPGRCLMPCRSADDCGEDSQCRPIEARVGDALGPVMACARTLTLPDDVQLSLGQREPDLRHGESALTVPGTADPALIYVQADCARTGFDVLKLRSLDLQQDVYDRAQVALGMPAQNMILHDGSALAALIFPDNPALLPSLSGLTLELGASAKQHVEVVLAARPRGRNVLDLNVFYVGGGVDVSGDPSGFRPGEPRVAAMLARMDLRLRALGLRLGAIEEHDVVGALREELAVLEVPKSKVGDRIVEGRPLRLDELFQLSAGVETASIDVFIVSDMGSYVGIAGGIPGVLGVHGSGRSGVAIAADMLGDLLDADLVLMHELGHFLGLFHTTEGSGAVLDPLSDTPACPIAQDLDQDHELSTVECVDYGADNLMFWTGVGSLLTTQQIAVMTDSVILH